jgi:hypothetical protein
MADKPKRVITAEQQEKMRLGRQKAYEERKAKKEAEAKAKKQAKEKQKAIQQQAIQEQKERRSNLKNAIEKRAEQKAKLEKLKTKKVSIIDEEAQFYEPDVLSPVEEDAEVSSNEEISNEEYKEKFISETKAVMKTLPKESRKLFKKATNKFDYNLSVEDNIKSMIEYVKMVVQHNITTAAKVKQIVESKPLKENQVVQEIPEVVEAEQIIESKMNYLMNKWK